MCTPVHDEFFFGLNCQEAAQLLHCQNHKWLESEVGLAWCPFLRAHVTSWLANVWATLAYRCEKDHNGDGSDQRYTCSCQCSFCEVTAHHPCRNVKFLALCVSSQVVQLQARAQVRPTATGGATPQCILDSMSHLGVTYKEDFFH